MGMGMSGRKQPISIVLVWLIFWAVAQAFHIFEKADVAGWQELVLLPLTLSCGYFCGFLAMRRFSVWSLSVLWLATPYFIFFIGWLQPVYAVLMVAIVSVSVFRVIRIDFRCARDFSPSEILGFACVLCWLYISGVGGHGFQSPDYVMHNGRLMDLVSHEWPVRYEDGRWIRSSQYGEHYSYLVSYLGYYMPAALFGKWFGFERAKDFLHVWTLWGCWLSLVWCWRLAPGAIQGVWLALLMLVFGSWGIVGNGLVFYRASVAEQGICASSVLDCLQSVAAMRFQWDQFWTLSSSGFFLGNYLPNFVSLYWAPHQVVAGWIMVGLFLEASEQQRHSAIFFLYALLAYWSPMILLATALFPIVIVISEKWKGLKAALSFENLAGGSTILLVFALYYFSGSASTNPAGWLWRKSDLSVAWMPVLVLHVFSWCVYAFPIMFNASYLSRPSRVVFGLLCLTLFLLPIYIYGVYSDLLSRGSSFLIFMLMIFFARHVNVLFARGRAVQAVLLLMLLLPTVAWDMRFNLMESLEMFSVKTPGQSVIDYDGGWQFLGHDQSWFVRYLSR